MNYLLKYLLTWSIGAHLLFGLLELFNPTEKILLPPIDNKIHLQDSMVNLCYGQVFNYKGMMVDADTLFCDTISRNIAADSVICFDVKFDSIKIVSRTISICEGSFFVFNGQELRRDTSLCFEFETQVGCDSISCLELTFRPPMETVDRRSICRGDTVFFEGLQLTRDTTICRRLTAQNGCDSIYCLEVNTFITNVIVDLQFCEGDTLFWKNVTFTTPGSFLIDPSEETGCDTVFSVNLTYYDPSPLEIISLDEPCEMPFVRLLAPGFDAYEWSTGETVDGIQVNEIGEYGLTVTDQNGCRASESIVISKIGIGEVAIQSVNPTCFDLSDGQMEVLSIEGGQAPFLYALNGAAFRLINRFEDLPAGQYALLVEGASGCRKSISFELEAPTRPMINLPDTLEVALGEFISLEPMYNFDPATISWEPSRFLSCDDCPFPVLSAEEDIVYIVQAADANNCQADTTFMVIVDNKTQIFIPNVFSPNGDGINDNWIIYGGPIIKQILDLQVLDRWGNLMINKQNVLPGTVAWDGMFKGQLAVPAAYLFRLSLERVDGIKEVREGEILLLR